jgi:hypothetical protein
VIIMPANSTGIQTGYLAGRYGQFGHLFSPGGQRGPWPFMPYALDNGRFPAWSSGKPWDEGDYLALLEWAKDSCQAPRWVLVPDVVADADATLREWETWAPRLHAYGWPLAFAAQDGMTPDDVPSGAEVVFLGGTDAWKRPSIRPWCEAFPRVHVGRVNTLKWLWHCHDAGAESCDGTGWFRGSQTQLAGLMTYLRCQAGEEVRDDQTDLFREMRA